MPEEHAYLSASGAARWLKCTPSVKLEHDYGKDDNSEFAREGSAAHALAELNLKWLMHQIAVKDYEEKKKFLEDVGDINNEMREKVANYCFDVIERYNAAYKTYGDKTVMLFEQKLDFSPWVKEGFGTGDVVIITPEYIHIIDLKYGKGVPVSADDNPQLKLYGLGAYNTYNSFYEVNKIKTTIMQPRLDSISDAEYDLSELLAWADNTVKPAAELAFAGEGAFCAGEHCRFCKAKAVCKHRSQTELDFVEPYIEESMPPKVLTDDEISTLYLHIANIRSYLTDLEEYALKEALQGHKFPGLKLVEGRSNRKYADDIKAAQTLIEAGYPDTVIYEKLLLSLTKMEKVVGAKKLNILLGDLIVKPQGKPTLVSEADKRSEINGAESAKLDFGAPITD